MDASDGSTVLLFVLLFAALVVGVFIGRASRRPQAPGIARYNDDYMRGLNYLLNEQPDRAVESFVASLAVNDDTVETHLALGALMRRRGEVDKAIRIHQNLLARPGLSRGFRDQADLELARDHLAAGLLGRAEQLLSELAGRDGALGRDAEGFLLEVYEREREWDRAAELAARMARRDAAASVRLAHYHCERAETALAEDDVRAAEAALDAALRAEPDNPRALLLRGRIAFDAGRHRKVLPPLERLFQTRPALIPEALGMLVEAHEQLGRERDLMRLLEKTLAGAPTAEIAVALGERIRRRDGESAALGFLAGEIVRRPSLVLFQALLDGHPTAAEEAEGELPDATRALAAAVAAMLSGSAGYRCTHCGLAGNTLHWQCPGCKTWGATEPAPRQLAR